jgi:hypothetical protein
LGLKSNVIPPTSKSSKVPFRVPALHVRGPMKDETKSRGLGRRGLLKGAGVTSASAALLLLVWTGCAHPVQTETPMHPVCRELPTVEACLASAQVITDACLKKCVEMQCTGIKINCRSEIVQKSCAAKNNPDAGTVALGYVERFSDTPTSCDSPSKEVNWCEEKASPDCRAQAMVHELAHSCGWRHGQGLGVPGDDGFLRCD